MTALRQRLKSDSSVLQRMLALTMAILCVAGVVGMAFIGDEVDDDHEILATAGSSDADDPRFSEEFSEEFGEFDEEESDEGSSGEASDSVEISPDGGVDGQAPSLSAGGAPGSVGATGPAGPAPADPGQPTSPTAGTYTYDINEDGDDEVAHVKVERTGGPPNDTRIQTVDDYQEDRRVFSWRTDGMYWLEIGGADPSEPTCQWEPDILLMKFPVRVGSSWPFDSRCRISDPDFGDIDLHVSGTIKVSGTERVIVGGEPIDTYVVQTDVVTEFSATFEDEPVSSTSEIREISNFAPRIGLDVKSVETSRETSDGEVEESRLERKLRSPRPT